MVTAIALSLVCAALSGLAYPVWTMMHNAELATTGEGLSVCEFDCNFIPGAAIVREIRFTLARQRLSA